MFYALYAHSRLLFPMSLQGHPSSKTLLCLLALESKHIFVTTGHFLHCSFFI